MDDFIRWSCSACGKRCKAPPSFSGRKTKCPKCGSSTEVPLLVQPTSSAVRDVTPSPVASSVPTPIALPSVPRFHLLQNGHQLGPFHLNQMREFVTSRRLGPGDLVWREGTPQWLPARDIADLFPVAEATGPEVSALVSARVDRASPPPLAKAEPAHTQSYLLSLEGDAQATRLSSRILGGAYQAVWSLMVANTDEDEITHDKILAILTQTFELGWVAVSRNQWQIQETTSAPRIGHDLNDDYTTDQMLSCLKLASVIAEVVLNSECDGFVGRNAFAGDILKYSSNKIIKDVTFGVERTGGRLPTAILERISRTLAAVFVLGYVAAKCPEELRNYFTLCTSENGALRGS